MSTTEIRKNLFWVSVFLISFFFFISLFLARLSVEKFPILLFLFSSYLAFFCLLHTEKTKAGQFQFCTPESSIISPKLLQGHFREACIIIVVAGFLSSFWKRNAVVGRDRLKIPSPKKKKQE